MDKLFKIIYGVVIGISIWCAFVYTTSCADGTSYVKDKYSQFDEQIALCNVNAILHPGDTKHFVFYIISGSTTFYGRVMMVTDAVFSFIPDKIWGLEGQVIATRLTHFFVLLLSIHLLISLFINDSLLRLMTLIFVLVSPYFIYFSFVPKPEPFVLFFLTLFLKGFIKSEWSFGKHFIWLGFAYGCKISVLPLIPVFFVLPIIYEKQKIQFVFKTIEILKSVLWTIGGFLLCIPCLILSPIKPVFLHSYITQTFGSASKTYDDQSINFFSWGHQLFYKQFSSFPLLVILFIVLIFVLAIYLLVKNKKISTAHLLFGVGLVQVFLIFFMTKRIWPHYLFVGLTFSIIGASALFETIITPKLKWISLIFLLLIIPQAFTFALDVKALHEREKDEKYIQVKQDGIAAFNYLKAHGINYIAYDLSTFVPNKLITIGHHYEPFPSLKKDTDFRIESINDYGNLVYQTGYQAIVFQKNYPADSINIHSKQYFMKDSYSAFLKYIPAYYHLDTCFGGVKVVLKN